LFQDYVVGKAIRVMGPDVVLGYIPLGITGNEQVSIFLSLKFLAEKFSDRFFTLNSVQNFGATLVCFSTASG
jgi:hypothetical protein